MRTASFNAEGVLVARDMTSEEEAAWHAYPDPPPPGMPAKVRIIEKETTMTTTPETRTRKPETYADGLGEIIRAHRLYIGLSQKDMAERMGKDRRDYSRIEANRAACPPGLLSRIEELSDAFAMHVEQVLDAADISPSGIDVEVRVGGESWDEWQRLVAGRAAVEASEDAPVRLVVVNTAQVG